jgi:hypothetical protein
MLNRSRLRSSPSKPFMTDRMTINAPQRAERNTEEGHQGDERHETGAPLGPQIAQPDEEFDGIQHCARIKPQGAL